MTANIDLADRWRTCPDFRPWTAHHHWYCNIRPLYRCRLRSTSRCIDQIGTSNIGANLEREYRLGAGTKS